MTELSIRIENQIVKYLPNTKETMQILGSAIFVNLKVDRRIFDSRIE